MQGPNQSEHRKTFSPPIAHTAPIKKLKTSEDGSAGGTSDPKLQGIGQGSRSEQRSESASLGTVIDVPNTSSDEIVEVDRDDWERRLVIVNVIVV